MKNYCNMLKILTAENFATKLKATVQATGRLGFTDATKKGLKLSTNSYILIAQDEDTQELFLAVKREPDGNAFRVCKSGSYFYLTTKLLFDYLNIDYKKQTVIFDLTRSEEHDKEMGGEAYKMNKRIIKRRCENVDE